MVGRIILLILGLCILWLIVYCPVTANRFYLKNSIKMNFSRFRTLYAASPANWQMEYGGPVCRIPIDPPQDQIWYGPDYKEYTIFLPYFSFIRYKMWKAHLEKVEQDNENANMFNEFVTEYGAIVKQKQEKSKAELEAAIAEMTEQLKRVNSGVDYLEIKK